MTRRSGTTMKAVVLDAFGGVDRLSLRDVPIPVPAAEQVLIRVEAAGIGSWDADEREGGYDGIFGMESAFPYILGWDGVGVVDAVGPGVTRVRRGDRVYAATMPLPDGGFYAEHAVLHQDHVAPVPQGLSTEQAAAAPWDALTAQSGIELLDLRAGATVMVFGASGGIGHLAVQFAKHRGAQVLAVASGDDGVDLVRRLGADLAIDGRRQDVVAAASRFAPVGLDAALTTVGGAAANEALGAVRRDGRVACPHGVTPEPILASGAKLLMYNGDRGPGAMARLSEAISSGSLQVHVSGTFPMDQVRSAHERLKSHYVGKLVLRIADPKKGDDERGLGP